MQFTNKTIRRQDRTLQEERALEILETGEFGVLSMQAENAQGAYGIPLSYVWDHHQALYIHCAPIGRKLNCIDKCNHVSFCVIGRTNIIPEKFTTGYESIVMQCTAHHQLPEDERRNALTLFIAKYCPQLQEIGKSYAEKSFHRTEIIRLDIQTISGKAKNLF